MGITVVLLKMGADENSRVYLDFPTPREAVKGVLKMFEQIHVHEIEGKGYTMADVFNFLDSVAELVVMM